MAAGIHVYSSDPELSVPKIQQYRTSESYERELAELKASEICLRAALARDENLLREKDELIHQQDLLSRESDHRMLNGLQMIVSVLSLQSRTTENVETASQLAAAANRVATIERVHRQLHRLDRTQTVEFRTFLEELCRDMCGMVTFADGQDQPILVEGTEAQLQSATGIPLGFIASELITNAVKYGKGRIRVRLERNSETGYALSVANDGSALPEQFDPANSKGLGMRIISSLVRQIKGELRFDRGETGQGTRFIVLFEGATGAG